MPASLFFRRSRPEKPASGSSPGRHPVPPEARPRSKSGNPGFQRMGGRSRVRRIHGSRIGSTLDIPPRHSLPASPFRRPGHGRHGSIISARNTGKSATAVRAFISDHPQEITRTGALHTYAIIFVTSIQSRTHRPGFASPFIRPADEPTGNR